MIDIRRDVPQIGTTLTAALGLAVVLCVVWLVSNVIMAEALRGVILLVAVFAVMGVAGKTLSDWRSGVYLFITWLLFEDLVRKYTGNSMYVYFGKDALVGITYVSFVTGRFRRDTEPFRVPFNYALGLFFLLGLVQVFNSSSPSVFYGILGLKLYFYYVPLMFVGYALLRTERDLHRFLIVNMGLAGVIALLGIVQSIVGVNFLNPHGGADIEGLGHLVRVAPSSGLAVARPPSVFVSDGRFAIYLILVFILGLGAAGYLLLRTKRGRRIVFLAAALVAVATVVSGSRGAFCYGVASALVLGTGMLWGSPPTPPEKYRLIKALRRSFVFAALALSLAVALFPDVVGARWAFYAETLWPDSPYYEASHRVWDYPVDNLLGVFSDREWVTGHGIGTASLGIQYVRRILEAPATNIATESGYGVLILELGILGPILWLVWTSSLMFAAAKVVLKLKGSWAFPVGLSIAWFAFLLLFPFTFVGIQPYQNFVLNAYFWLLVGVLFRLPALVAQQLGSTQLTVDSQFVIQNPKSNIQNGSGPQSTVGSETPKTQSRSQNAHRRGLTLPG